jgi:hypothetical protein
MITDLQIIFGASQERLCSMKLDIYPNDCVDVKRTGAMKMPQCHYAILI